MQERSPRRRERSPRRRDGDLVVNSRWLRDLQGPDDLSDREIRDLIAQALRAIQLGDAQHFSELALGQGSRPALRFFLSQVGQMNFTAEKLD